jgi:endo-1,4-beta-xylanase
MKFESSLQKIFSRRTLLKALGGASLVSASALGLSGCSYLGGLTEPFVPNPGLGARARSQKKVYGAAVQSWQLDQGDFAAAVRGEAAILVPETELKWDIVHPSRHSFNFAGYHRIASFARYNSIAMRGHTLLWHHSNPKWLEGALHQRHMAEKILRYHIETVLQETAPMIRSWDVVNEAIDPHSSRNDGLRESVWLKTMGESYIATAFHIAHNADPKLHLVYNDYGFEYDDALARRKRQSALRLLDTCVRQKVPVHGLGIQSHLSVHKLMNTKEFGAFLENVKALGLKVTITELDVDLAHLSGRIDDRIAIAQNYVKAYLDVVQQSVEIDTLLTWGLSDRYSWLKSENGDSKGALPLDTELRRSALWNTLDEVWLGEKRISPETKPVRL